MRTRRVPNGPNYDIRTCPLQRQLVRYSGEHFVAARIAPRIRLLLAMSSSVIALSSRTCASPRN